MQSGAVIIFVTYSMFFLYGFKQCTVPKEKMLRQNENVSKDIRTRERKLIPNVYPTEGPHIRLVARSSFSKDNSPSNSAKPPDLTLPDDATRPDSNFVFLNILYAKNDSEMVNNLCATPSTLNIEELRVIGQTILQRDTSSMKQAEICMLLKEKSNTRLLSFLLSKALSRIWNGVVVAMQRLSTNTRLCRIVLDFKTLFEQEVYRYFVLRGTNANNDELLRLSYNVYPKPNYLLRLEEALSFYFEKNTAMLKDLYDIVSGIQWKLSKKVFGKVLGKKNPSYFFSTNLTPDQLHLAKSLKHKLEIMNEIMRRMSYDITQESAYRMQRMAAEAERQRGLEAAEAARERGLEAAEAERQVRDAREEVREADLLDLDFSTIFN